MDNREQTSPAQGENTRRYTIDELLAQMEPQYQAYKNTMRLCIAGLTDHAARLAAQGQEEQLPTFRRLALDSMLAAYYEGKQIALHRISYQRKDMVVNPQHYRRLTLKQTMDAENVLLEQGKVIDFPLKPSDLSRYDEVLYD